jgi:hypothetical protein
MEIVKALQLQYPHLTFRPGPRFSWSPETREIMYDTRRSSSPLSWSVLHETAHALLEHSNYRADLELIQLEVAAWERAKLLARDFDIEIAEDHIQDCLDTYRDWLYQRSVCPKCNNKSLQQEVATHYQCFNCHAVWKVTPSRFCRAYRSTKATQPPYEAFYATEIH